MVVQVDGVVLDTVEVTSATSQEYVFPVALSAGNHLLQVGFINDYYDPERGIDRNLFVQRVAVTSGPMARRADGGYEAREALVSLVPEEFSLSQNYPNPFNPETVIRFGLREATSTRLVVYDARGREVRRLVNGTLPAGMHTVRWDGKDASGRRVSSGVYFFRLEAGSFAQMKRMLLLR